MLILSSSSSSPTPAPTKALLGVLPLHTAWAATVRRAEGELNVFLGVQADSEGWAFTDGLVDPDMTLAGEHTGMAW